jgi:tetratricopeptide (TPR) repeat protein
VKDAHELSGARTDIAERLLQSYLDAERWEEAAPIIDAMIADVGSKKKGKDAFRFHYLRGQLHDRQGSLGEALESYQQCQDLNPTYIPNLMALGKAYIGLQSWQQALRVYQTLLLHQMKIGEPDEKRDMYYHLGCVRMELGETRRAKDMFNRALGIDRGHQPSLDRLAQLKG